MLVLTKLLSSTERKPSRNEQKLSRALYPLLAWRQFQLNVVMASHQLCFALPGQFPLAQQVINCRRAACLKVYSASIGHEGFFLYFNHENFFLAIDDIQKPGEQSAINIFFFLLCRRGINNMVFSKSCIASAIQVSFSSRCDMHLGNLRADMGKQHVSQQQFP